VAQSARRAPSAFGKRRSIDVRIYSEGHAERAREPRGDVRMTPSGLRDRFEKATLRRARLEIERAERSNAQRGERAMLLPPLTQHAFNRGQRGFGIGGGKALLRANILRPGAEDADAFRSTQLDACQESFAPTHLAALRCGAPAM